LRAPRSSHVHRPTLSHSYSLHDDLPISAATTVRKVRASSVSMMHRRVVAEIHRPAARSQPAGRFDSIGDARTPLSVTIMSIGMRSEEHTSELQSRENLVCRLLLEKKTIQ